MGKFIFLSSVSIALPVTCIALLVISIDEFGRHIVVVI